jgi:hypothetical protein
MLISLGRSPINEDKMTNAPILLGICYMNGLGSGVGNFWNPIALCNIFRLFKITSFILVKDYAIRHFLRLPTNVAISI